MCRTDVFKGLYAQYDHHPVQLLHPVLVTLTEYTAVLSLRVEGAFGLFVAAWTHLVALPGGHPCTDHQYHLLHWCAQHAEGKIFVISSQRRSYAISSLCTHSALGGPRHGEDNA